ncbi:FadR/GntR family transcriptional regulator [Corallococcus sp. AB049A]
MGMGHGGLVAYVEAQIERDIALGRIHPSGRFGSEAKLARRYDVCRGTIREALRRLAARGLVVQRPGRKTRAVPLDESLTLENLGLALHDTRSPQARWLLEGYFSLRRQVLVELLSDCCARASKRDLDQLGSICFGLWDAARWESGAYCARVEFELLRLAARVADRPGHVLLVQSLQRAFMVGAAQLLPLLGGEPLRQWVNCAKDALHDRDTRALQHELPALMKACDDLVLDAFAPALKEPVSPAAHPSQEKLPSELASAIAQAEALAAATAPDDAIGERPCLEVHGPGPVAHDSRDTEALPGVPCPRVAALDLAPDHGAPRSPTASMFAPCKPEMAYVGEDVTRADLGSVSECQAGPGASLLEAGLRWAAYPWRLIGRAVGPVLTRWLPGGLPRRRSARGSTAGASRAGPGTPPRGGP